MAIHLEMLAKMEAAGKDHPILGCIATCTITGFQHPASEVRRMLEAEGLEGAVLPNITSRLALSRALEAVTKGIPQVLLRKLVDNEACSCHVVVRETVDATTEEPAYEVVLKVVHNKKEGTHPLFSFSTQRGEEVLQPLIERYAGHYTARDVGQTLYQLMRKYSAIPLNFGGKAGVYFMPAASFEVMEKLRSFVERLARETCTPSSFRIARVLDEEGEKEYLRLYAVKAVLDEIGHLRGEIARLRSLDDPPEEMIAHMLLQIDQVGGKAALYARILTMQVEDIAQALEPLRADYQLLLRRQSPFVDPDEIVVAQPTSAWWIDPCDAPPPVTAGAGVGRRGSVRTAGERPTVNACLLDQRA